MSRPRRPLAGLTIVDVVAGPLAPATRYLAELGGRVIHIAAKDYDVGTRDGLKLFAAHAGKQILRVDPEDQASITSALDAIGHANAVVIDPRHGAGGCPALQPEALRSRFADGVIVNCSDFGLGNVCSSWSATDPVLHALCGELSRSGIRGCPPLLPPGELAVECAAAQLAYVVLVALYQHLQTAEPDCIDFAMLDGAIQALDPGYGISGSATLGRPASKLSPDRPPRGFMYPIIACADGYVRICLLAPRQWRGMFDWMGRPAKFSSPDFEKVGVRYKSVELIPAIAAFFADKTRDELEAGAKVHGVPLSALLDGTEAIDSEHFKQRRVFREVATPSGARLTLPNGLIEIDGQRMVADCTDELIAPPVVPPSPKAGLPLSGIKVLDLGVIVVGGEQSRLLADLGADVVKIESRAFADGTRQTDLSIGMSVSFAAGHRNKRSLGLNLRSAEGRTVFEDLVREADVVLTNFKPGTMEALGLGYARLADINPEIILVESSAFGPTGPWAKRMGYGPLVRAATGLTSRWCYPDDEQGFSDSVTIYPDHVGGRVSALGVLALLIDRARSGRGGLVQNSQAEIVLAQQAWQTAASLAGHDDPWQPADAPWGVFRSAGEDDWCVITARDDRDWCALCSIVGGLDPALDRSSRLCKREAIEIIVGDWVGARSAQDAMTILQAAGIPAAKMLRVAELPFFPAIAERGILREARHPYLGEPFYTEARTAMSGRLSAPPEYPAPLAGEHTFEVMRDWLGLDDAAITDLIVTGALEPISDEIRAALPEIARG